jgi:hypothetical protein
VTLPDPDHIPPGPGLRQEHPLRTSAIVIYATLALLALTIPRGLVNWSRNFDPNLLQQATYSVAQWVQLASRQLGLDLPYAHGRALFLKLTGKQED